MASADPIDVAVVGGGPAGLATATSLARDGAHRVVVLEREARAGGIPRHAGHQGFGARDLKRLMSGPAYAERLVERALAAGCELWAETQVTGWSDDGGLELTSPLGRRTLHARAIVLATGCRERPRAARLVPGSRDLRGVMTTGTLQQRVHLGAGLPGHRAIVVGADHVSASAVATLAHGGARAVAMVTERRTADVLAAYRAAILARHRVPLRARTEILMIHGRERVEGVTMRELDTGDLRHQACDMVVFTADWVPDGELAILGGAELDAGTRGPLLTTDFMTTRPGLFAVGNVVRGAEAADVVALEGRAAARSIRTYLSGRREWPSRLVRVTCAPPLAWVAPNAVSAPAGSRRFAIVSHTPLLAPRIEVVQGGRLLWGRRVARVLPDRPAHIPGGWVRRVRAMDGPVVVSAG